MSVDVRVWMWECGCVSVDVRVWMCECGCESVDVWERKCVEEGMYYLYLAYNLIDKITS